MSLVSQLNDPRLKKSLFARLWVNWLTFFP